MSRSVGDANPRFVLDLACTLTPWFDVTVLAPLAPGAREHEICEGVAIHRYRYAPFRSWEQLAYRGGILPLLRQRPWLWLLVPLLLCGLIAATRRLHKRYRFDCVHCHWLIPQGLAAVLAFRGSNRPRLIATSHGGDAYTFRHGWKRRLLQCIARRVDALTVVSEPLRRMFEQEFALNSVHPIHIPMGVDVDSFLPGKADAEWARSIGLQSPVILFVGRLVEKKGVSYLLDAMADPSLQHMRANLAIVGDGPLRSALEHQTAALHLEQQVKFLGAQPGRLLPRCYASADLVVAPSVQTADGDCEGLPTVLLEAMASGAPVVSTPVGGIPQLIEDKVSGVLVPPADSEQLARALASLLQCVDMRRTLAVNARAKASAFDWRRTAGAYKELICSVLDSNAPVQPGQQN